MSKKKVQVSVALAPALVRRLDRLAKAQNVSRSALITRLCEDGLEDQELFVKTMSDPIMAEVFVKAFRDREVIKHMVTLWQEDATDEQIELFGQVLEKMAESSK